MWFVIRFLHPLLLSGLLSPYPALRPVPGQLARLSPWRLLCREPELARTVAAFRHTTGRGPRSMPSTFLHRTLPVLVLASLSAAAQAGGHCGGASHADPNASDPRAREISTLSMEYWADQPAGMVTCSYGYWAAKCGDFEAAHKIFDKCIAKGYAGAMIWKGLLLEDGSGVPRDPAAAAAMYKRAAESADEGYAALGKLHYATALYEGNGVERDEAEARKWFERAAAQGSEDAKTFLRTGHHTGSRNQRGEGVGTPQGAVATAKATAQRLVKQASESLPGLPGEVAGLGLGVLALVAAGAWHQRRQGRRDPMEADAASAPIALAGKGA
jgi:TPR repeat protein